MYSTKDLREVLTVQAIRNTLGVERIILKVFSRGAKIKNYSQMILPIDTSIPLKFFINSERIYLCILKDCACGKTLLQLTVLVIKSIQGKNRNSVTQAKFSFSYSWE